MSMLRALAPGKYTRTLLRVIRLLSRPNTYSAIIIALVVLITIGTVLLWIFEQGPSGEPALRDIDNSFVFMVQNITAVPIGATPPLSMWGRLTAITFVILGAALRGIFVAAIVSGFVNAVISRGKGVRRVETQGHVLICGWNSRVKEIVQVLRNTALGSGVPIAILANLKENPLPDTPVKFVSGNPMEQDDLERAGVKTARSAIVLADESDGVPHNDATFDARSVLTVLAVKSANPEVHVVAQLRDPANRPHFERAHADEVVASAEMSEGLLARASVNQGIAQVYSDLLRRDKVPELFVVNPAQSLVGKSFQAALVHTNVREQHIVIGVLEGEEVLLCPPGDRVIGSGTRLVMLGNRSQNGKH